MSVECSACASCKGSLLACAADRCKDCNDPDCPGIPASQQEVNEQRFHESVTFTDETVEFRGVSVPVTDPLPAIPGDWAGDYPDGTFQSTFAAVFEEAFNLLVERQRKYGPENIREQGIYGVFTRMSADKIERLRRALNGRVVEGRIELDEFVDAADETVEDALLDIANYALIMLALKRGVWGHPLV